MSFDYQRLSDPGYFRENRLDAHSDHRTEGPDGQSPRFSLNGYWKFFHARNEKQVIPGFESDAYDCRPWAEIAVPAHIQMEGYGHPQYCNTQYPWDGTDDWDIGKAPEYFNPVACYVRYFDLPEGWEGQRVILSMQGAESCAAVWLNGQYIGFASDSFTPDEFELTGKLRKGENKLAVRVYRWNAGSWLEDQDFMRFSGLFREVYLERIPAAHVEDIQTETRLDDQYRDAELLVRLRISGKAAGRILLKDGEKETASVPLQEGESQEYSIPVPHPVKWSAENPYLYTLEVLLTDKEGALIEKAEQKVGFRRFELKNGIMCLNGKRIVFKGTNRHDFCAETGRAVTPEKIRRDLITMKRNNINAIRTSHYPNSSVLYSLADELGLYVIDECNMETHGVWNAVATGSIPLSEALPGDRAEYLPMMLDRIRSMVGRDRNHPCILIWSCGNESLSGTVILEMSRELKRLDPTRLVHYEGVDHDHRHPEISDVYTQMYAPADSIPRFLKEHPDKPYILCEYTHSMGNSNGAMHKYTRLAYQEERYQGGFIWDYIDQAVRMKDRGGNPAYGYGGDFDDRPNDGDFSGNGIAFADGTETPKMQEVRYNYRNIETDFTEDGMIVRNRFLFTDTSAFSCLAVLKRNGAETKRKKLEISVAPLTEKKFPLPFEIPGTDGEYTTEVSFRLKEDTAWAAAGHEIAWGQYIVGRKKEKAAEPKGKLRIVRGEENLGIFGNGFSALYALGQGRLISYRCGDREMLKTAPAPCFWRAPTDNDRGNGMPERYAAWKIADLYSAPVRTPWGEKGEDPVTLHENGSVSVTAVWRLGGQKEARCRITYTFEPSGRVLAEMKLTAAECMGEMPLFGWTFKTDADFDRLRYYGLGPEENYIDRREGARLGIFETTARENLSRYLYPQECGNRTGVRWAEVKDFRGRGLRFTAEDGMEFSILPYTAHELENAAHAYELPEAYCTVIRAAKVQMGVGGDDSWGARTHEEYLVRPEEGMSFRFAFEPLI